MKIRNTLIALLVGALIALPLKIYQLLKVVDYSTGFYKKGDFSNFAIPAVLVLCVVLIAVLAFTSKEFPQYSPNKKSVPMGLLGIALAVAVGYQSVTELINPDKAMFGGTIGMVYSGLGLISVLSFIFLTVGFFSGISLAESKPVIMMIPVFWMGLRMVMTFLNLTTKANISENMYDLVMMVFMLIFLLSTAKFMSGAAEKTAKMTFASGCAAILFAALATIPRYVFKIYNSSKHINIADQLGVRTDTAFEPNIADLALMAFAIGILFYISTPVKKRAALPAANNMQRPMMPRPMPAAPMGGGYPAAQRYPARPYQQPAMGAPMMGQSMMRSPYMQAGRPIPPGPLPGAGADVYTTRGAGMKITDDFAIRSSDIASAAEGRYGGLNSFREGMLSGQRALEVMDTSSEADTEFNMSAAAMFSAGDIASAQDSAELNQITEEVSESLSSLFAQRDNMTKPPKEAIISAGSDEADDPGFMMREADYPPPPPSSTRSVSLGSGRYNGKLSQHLNEMEGRRSRRNARTPIDDMPYDERYSYGVYEDEYYDDPRGGYDDYDGEYAYERYGEYAEDYEDDYYDEADYGPSDYYEYDEEYDDEYDEYDEYGEYEDDYYDDPRGDYGYSDYDDEGYSSW